MQCIEGPSASEEAGCSIVHHNHACGRGTQRYRNAAGSPFSLRHACTTFACLLTPLLTHARGKMLPVVLDRAKPHCDRLREPPPRAPLGDNPPARHTTRSTLPFPTVGVVRDTTNTASYSSLSHAVAQTINARHDSTRQTIAPASLRCTQVHRHRFVLDGETLRVCDPTCHVRTPLSRCTERRLRLQQRPTLMCHAPHRRIRDH